MRDLWRRRLVRVPSFVLSAFFIIVAFLKWESAYALLAEDVAKQITWFLDLLGSGWLPVVVLFFIGFIMFGVSLGPDRVEAWVRWIAKHRRNQAEDTGSRELETQERWRGQDALEKYFDLMHEWMDDESRPLSSLPYDDPRRRMARTRTLDILKRLDPNGKRDVLQFLQEHKLIEGDDPVVRLETADLSNANLARLVLVDANLAATNLRGADLSDAAFNIEAGSSYSMGKAAQRDAPLWAFNKFGACADLSRANLSSAILKRARIGGCSLLAANFAGADLEEADLRGTKLQLARNLKQEQIEKAYGAHQQDEFLPDTLLPDYLEAPAAWNKLAHEQKVDRG